MPVSPATETKLRAAMQRLLDGTPQRTDGALTKENLAREAVRDANQKITTLNGRLDALATVTANLYRENQALRAALDHRTQLAPLPGKEPN